MSDPPAPERAVLLDLDDVLVPWNTPGHWQWAWKPQGPKLGDRHVRSAIRRTLRSWDRRRWHGLVGSDPPTDVAARHHHLEETLTAIAGRRLPEDEMGAVLRRFDHPAGEIESFEDVRPALLRLESEKVPVGVVTDLPEEAARWALRRVGLSNLPLILHAGEPAASRLPARAGFRAACERLGTPASRTLYVGDLFWSDVRAAARAGLSAFLLDRFDRFSGVEAHRIASLAELPALRPLGPEPSGAPEGPEGPDDAEPADPAPKAP